MMRILLLPVCLFAINLILAKNLYADMSESQVAEGKEIKEEEEVHEQVELDETLKEKDSSVSAEQIDKNENDESVNQVEETQLTNNSKGDVNTKRETQTLHFGGYLQFRIDYENITIDIDSARQLGMSLSSATFDILGDLPADMGFQLSPRLEAHRRELGLERAFIFWSPQALFNLRAGVMSLPFSQEGVLSDRDLLTLNKGSLYYRFLSESCGFTGEDIGVAINGGKMLQSGTFMLPFSYDFGIYNGGYQSFGSEESENDPAYLGKPNTFRSKSIHAMISISPTESLTLQGAVAQRIAEKFENAGKDGQLFFAPAAEAGFEFRLNHLELSGELASGKNAKGSDATIFNHAPNFFAFYGMSAWHEEYSNGRASDTWLKIEGIDADMKKPNDGKYLYSAGINYFLSTNSLFQIAYSILHPITEVEGEGELEHNLSMQWRLLF